MDRVDQLPLPSLQWYTGFSGLALFYVLVYAVTTREGLWSTLSGDLWCTAAVLNMSCCALFLLASFIQSVVFGKLQLVEQQHMRDKFWNFVFYKFIFVFGVLNVQEMGEMMCWCAWFAVLGTLLLTEQLCRDRFQLLSFSPNTVPSAHAKVIILLVMVFLSCAGLFMVCAIIGWQYGFAHFTFLYSEVFILFTRSMHTIIRYIIHLWDMHHDGTWENRSTYTYYAELVLELAALCVEFLHHIHMLMWANMLLSVASLILLMKLRFLYQEIQRRLRRHRTFLLVSRTLENRFSLVPQDELSGDDVCAICWERMSSARRLPCRHVFHTGCLRLWLEQDTVCPTCRCSLSEELQANGRVEEEEEEEGEGMRGRWPRWRRRLRRHRNWLLHFNGASIASWLPSFSVELHNGGLIGNGLEDLHQGAQQVHSMFPNVPLHTITLDLAETRSISITIEHILSNDIYLPRTGVEQPHIHRPLSSTQPLTTSPLTTSPVTQMEFGGNGFAGQRSDRHADEPSDPQQRDGEEEKQVERQLQGPTLRQRRTHNVTSSGTQRMVIRDNQARASLHEYSSGLASDDDITSFSSLQRRKIELLLKARRRYLLKHQ